MNRTETRPGHWRNWAGNQSAAPIEIATPASVEELANVIGRAAVAGRRVKAVGSGHSFSGIAVADDLQIHLERLQGITSVDRETGRVRVLAGTRLADLNPLLWTLGLAMPNLGDIDAQTIAGAIATGTHGTGAGLPGLAAAVRAIRIVTADGRDRWCSPDVEPDLFAAARVGLGALGVIAEYEIACLPAYLLRAREEPARRGDVLDGLDARLEAHRHLEFYWFPHTDRVQIKVIDRAPEADFAPLPRWRERVDDDLLANVLFERINRLAAARPTLTPRINQISARALSAREYVDRSYRVFCTRRSVRFVESEYAVPRAALVPVLTEMRRWIDRSGATLPFPVEVRFAAADDIWLSTGYDRGNAYIAIHQYHRLDHRPYFAAFEAIVAEHAGRPH